MMDLVNFAYILHNMALAGALIARKGKGKRVDCGGATKCMDERERERVILDWEKH